MAKKQRERMNDQTTVESLVRDNSNTLNQNYQNEFARILRGTTEYGDTIASGSLRTKHPNGDSHTEFYYNVNPDSVPHLWIKENGNTYRSSNGIIDPEQLRKVRSFLQQLNMYNRQKINK